MIFLFIILFIILVAFKSLTAAIIVTGCLLVLFVWAQGDDSRNRHHRRERNHRR